MTDSPAAPAAKIYTEDEVALLLKAKLTAEASAAQMKTRNAELTQTVADQEAQIATLRKQLTRLELLDKEVQLMKEKYVDNRTDW